MNTKRPGLWGAYSAVFSRTKVEAVNGAIAHHRVFSGLPYCRINLQYTFTFFLSVFKWEREVVYIFESSWSFFKLRVWMISLIFVTSNIVDRL